MNYTKQILALIILSFGLVAFAPQPNLEGTKCHIVPTYIDMYYGLGSRFEAITKSDLVKAKSVADFFKPEHVQPLLNYVFVEVVLVEQDKPTDKRLRNDFFKLSDAQRKMLSQMDYSAHFLIRAPYKTINQETREEEYFNAQPHFTVVPETQASYSLGEKGLIEYIRQENKENTANLDEDKLQFAKLYFTINTDGSISNVYLDRSCGNMEIDKAMQTIIKQTSGNWKPAAKADGTPVAQELAITFGSGQGC